MATPRATGSEANVIMGWQTEHGKLIGDEPFDLMRTCLEQIANCYQEDHERDPTIEELLEYLRRNLNLVGRDLLQGLEQSEVVAISLKTKKLPKRQDYGVGDCFAIPIPGGFYYGRMLRQTAAGMLVEIYDLFSKHMLPIHEVVASKRSVLTYKHIHGLLAFRNRRWPIIGNEEVPENYDFAEFLLGSACTGFLIDKAGKESSAELSDVTRLERMIMFPPETVEERLAAKTKEPWPEIQESRETDLREIKGVNYSGERMAVMRTYLERIIACYQKDQRRKPTTEEILECLRQGFNLIDRQLLPELKGRELVTITLKTHGISDG